MRRKKQITVRRGCLEATGASKTLAKSVLESQISWALSKQTTKIEQRFGLLIIINSEPSGFQSRVVDPTKLVHGQECYSCTQHGQVEYLEVLESARLHAAQNAWTHDANDEAHVLMAGLSENGKRQLAGWISFQRQYRAAKEAGKTDGEAFDIACGRGGAS